MAKKFRINLHGEQPVEIEGEQMIVEEARLLIKDADGGIVGTFSYPHLACAYEVKE